MKKKKVKKRIKESPTTARLNRAYSEGLTEEERRLLVAMKVMARKLLEKW